VSVIAAGSCGTYTRLRGHSWPRFMVGPTDRCFIISSCVEWLRQARTYALWRARASLCMCSSIQLTYTYAHTHIKKQNLDRDAHHRVTEHTQSSSTWPLHNVLACPHAIQESFDHPEFREATCAVMGMCLYRQICACMHGQKPFVCIIYVPVHTYIHTYIYIQIHIVPYTHRSTHARPSTNVRKRVPGQKPLIPQSGLSSCQQVDKASVRVRVSYTRGQCRW